MIVRFGAEELVLKVDSRAPADAMTRGAPVTVGWSSADCLAFPADAS